MYLYQCYVTDPWKLCDDLVTVEKGVKKAWNPDSQTITFTTDSEFESEEPVYVGFFDTDDGDAGYVSIVFENPEIQYKIGRCSTDYTPFPAALSTETEKTWTITYNYTDKRVVLHCNGVQVAEVLLSSVCATASGWGDVWGKKPTQMMFGYYDDTSDTYCMSSNPGKYNGVIDSGE